MSKHLIIPDAHAHPEYDNDRFTALGRFILDERPDVVLCIGDFADMPSLSLYDKGKKSFEGRRFQRDIEATKDAMDKLFAPIDKHNKKSPKTRRYSPRFVMCLGNHEDRINRVTNDHSELSGTVGLHSLPYERWEIHPFKTTVTIDGIAYSHYFPAGLTGMPISGENIGASLVKKLHMSAVQGHSHLFNHYEHTRPDKSKIFGLSVGCYTHHNMIEGWNLNTHHMWWRGVVVLNGCGRWDGYYEELRALCQQKILDDYL